MKCETSFSVDTVLLMFKVIVTQKHKEKNALITMSSDFKGVRMEINMNRNPLVSIYMTTYYHERYVQQALESILSQKTDFPIQICISDDASKDKTIQILKAYEEKYDFIKVNYNTRNVGLTQNMFLAKSLCDGKYICDLSGDDYWIDNEKLQKQVEFLENNPEYYAVCTSIELRPDCDEQAIKVVPDKSLVNKTFTLDMFLRGYNLPMNGIMMRNPFLDNAKKELFSIMPKASPFIDDLTDNLLILMCGKAYILSDRMVAYRVRKKIKTDKNFNSINKDLSSYEKHIDLLNYLAVYFENIDFFNRYRVATFDGYIKALKSHNLKEFNKIRKKIPMKYNGIRLMMAVWKMIPQRTFNKLRRE